MESSFSFDGSWLGAYSWDEFVHWWFVSCPGEPFKALVGEELTPVLLRRNDSYGSCTAIIDELKPLFDLQKSGVHRVRIRGRPVDDRVEPTWTEYLMIRADYEERDGRVSFHDPIPISEAMFLPFVKSSLTDEHKRVYREIQKSFVFLNLLGVKSTSHLFTYDRQADAEFSALFRRGSTLQTRGSVDPLDNRVKCNLLPLTCNEVQGRNRLTVVSYDGKLSLPGESFREQGKTFLPITSDVYEKVLISVLGLTSENLAERVNRLNHQMTEVVRRIDKEKIWIVNLINDRVYNRMAAYFTSRNRV